MTNDTNTEPELRDSPPATADNCEGWLAYGRHLERTRTAEALRDCNVNGWVASNAYPSIPPYKSITTGETIECPTPLDADELAAAIETGELFR